MTAVVTKEKLDAWKKLYSENKGKLRANRISGRELNDYFITQYVPLQKQIPEFEQIVRLNAQENGTRHPEVVICAVG